MDKPENNGQINTTTTQTKILNDNKVNVTIENQNITALVDCGAAVNAINLHTLSMFNV